MASTRETRSATGKSAPRKLFTIEPTTTTTRKPKTKTTTKTTGKPKANMSKPRAKATSTGRVEKKAPAKKRKTSVGDKVKGLVEKAEGKVERKPGKKVRYDRFYSPAVLEPISIWVSYLVIFLVSTSERRYANNHFAPTGRRHQENQRHRWQRTPEEDCSCCLKDAPSFLPPPGILLSPPERTYVSSPYKHERKE